MTRPAGAAASAAPVEVGPRLGFPLFFNTRLGVLRFRV